MKNIIIKLALILLLFVFSDNAFAITLSDDSFIAGQTITISGGDFGTYGSYSNVCFNTDSSCYTYDSEGIVSWSPSSIRFIVPSFIYEHGRNGKVIIYNNADVNQVAELKYELEPYVTGIYDENGNLRTIAIPGEILILEGKAFGESGNRVQFPSADAKILSWSDTRIEIIVPNVTKEGDFLSLWYGSNKYHTTSLYTFKNITDDKYSAVQQYLNSTNLSYHMANLNQKVEVVVAVIDDGIYINHPDLKANIWKNTDDSIGDGIDNDGNGYIDDYFGYDFILDTEEMSTAGGHGTNVAGIIGAVGDNGAGISGIAKKVKLMSLIACNDEGCPTNAVISAINYAIDNGADIINLSLSTSMTSGFRVDYNSAIERAYNNNVLVIAAAGNGDTEGGIGQDLGFIPQSPVCNDGGKNMILGVGASDIWNENILSWSNNGECVDLYAPGEDILSTSVPKYSTYGDFYEFTSGTSFSTPMVAGFAALIMSAYPNMSARDVAGYIRKNTDSGLLNADKVIAKINKYYKPFSEISPTIEQAGEYIFSDVSTSYKNAQAINYLKSKEIIGGYPDGSFKPENTVNRAELMKILIGDSLPSGNYGNCFKDVKIEWFAPYICYAKQQGWIEGYSDGTFKPAQTVNRAEAIKMAIEVFNIALPTTISSNPYDDVPKDQWFAKYVQAAKNVGLFDIVSSYEASGGMRRGDIGDIIYRLLTIKKLKVDSYDKELDSQMDL